MLLKQTEIKMRMKYNANPKQFIVLLLITVFILIYFLYETLNLEFLKNINSTNITETKNFVNVDDGFKNFYQKMLEEYSNEIHSPEDFQNMMKNSINNVKNDFIQYHEDQVDLKNTLINQQTKANNNLQKSNENEKIYHYNTIQSTHESKINKLFKGLLSIIQKSKPYIGYQLKSENQNIIPKKFRLSRNILERIYGKNGIIDVAIHDTDGNSPILSKNFLNECLYLPDDMYESLKNSHNYFVDNIPETFEPGTYNGNGIIFIGGGKFSWLSLLGIENLRFTGSKLPIELIIPKEDEYEPQLCETILPRLNAKCVLLYELFPDLGNSKDNFKLSGYQYKSVSLLASSFEKVLFLDSDNIAVMNPDILFESDLFKSNGLILWPDFWKRVTHPMYYDLAGYKIGNKRIRFGIDQVIPSEFLNNTNDPDNDLPLHDREGAIPDLSTESGQILVNKKTHFKALLLNFYYNVYGPRHYYPLFSQGGTGEGDKETFYAASQFYNLPTYQVRKPVSVIGHWEDEKYHGVGMVQFDPIIDKLNEDEYKSTILKEIEILKDNFVYDENKIINFFDNAKSKPMFIHSNFPKFDPITLISEHKLINQQKNDEQWRLYSDQPDFGFDFELRQWELIKKYFCSTSEPFELKYLNNANISINLLCINIKERLQFLNSNPL
jgi:alpha 1,2-mannosyltransferase